MEDTYEDERSAARMVRDGSGRGATTAREIREQNPVVRSKTQRLNDYEVFDADGEEVLDFEDSVVWRIPLEKLNAKLWWTGIRLGVIRTHQRTQLAIAWDGPEILKRFMEWKPSGKQEREIS